LYDEEKSRTNLKVTANINLKALLGQIVTVEWASARGPSQTASPYKAKVVGIPSDGIDLQLDHKLPSGKSNPLQLSVKGLTDKYGTTVSIEGKVASSPAAPTDLTKAFVTTQLSATGAVHSLPMLTATGAIAPWHPAQRAIMIPGLISFDPAVTFDVGSSNTTSSNSVIVPSQFIRPFIFGLPNGSQIGHPDLNNLKPAKPFVINAMFGPRAEFDTLHGGVNVLGEGRAELYLLQLYQTTDQKTAAAAAGNPAIRDLLNLPQNGFSLAPYIQIDGGGHITSQSISNSGKAPPAVIPTYDIFRLYLGLHGTAQHGKATITFDGSWVNLVDPETVPYTLNKVYYSRELSGFQPHAKGTFNFYFDDAKHFAGSTSWENGRSPPTFTYLNKVTIGLQATY
jgi:hypothetical protein